MPKTKIQAPQYSLSQALNQLTIEQLKPLLKLVSKQAQPTRKSELVAAISKVFSNDGVQTIWQQLDTLQQAAIAETLYAPTGYFDEQKFQAKYGELPDFGTTSNRYHFTPSLLATIIHPLQRFIATDLQDALKAFVPQPEAIRIQGLKQLPETEALTLRRMEYEAPYDFTLMLKLIEQGKVIVSEKTKLPSNATITLLEKSLYEKDFYPIQKKKKHEWERLIGPIKCFAWPLVFQLGNFAEKQGKALSLTRHGRAALKKTKQEALISLWKHWLKNNDVDEFTRIDEIKGQQRSKPHLTAVHERRDKVFEALKQCPTGMWVAVDTIWRYIQATDLNFEVSRHIEKLYLCEPGYGCLGYMGRDGWSILQGRYTLCVLFEYAATLGFIDIAYQEPKHALGDYQDLWGGEELDFLSRYDGLRYIRLNNLGAYCLGLTQHYDAEQHSPQTPIKLSDTLLEVIAQAPVSQEEILELSIYADTDDEIIWALNEEKLITATEQGRDIKSFQHFLELRYGTKLPPSFQTFFKTCQQHSSALRIQETALVITCQNSDLAKKLATSRKTKPHCQRLGEQQLVVPLASEEAFRKAVKTLKLGIIDS